ncbi:hypothetical protein [Halalkalibacillus halophilus]|uniref:hypothetical protein n=1 Tax=Halalkalibacillus halophilus TaxID=392827 RepID=UPI000405A7E9|nr:hypothetical protein [Halalkalibacillus halophilus]
MFRTLLSHEFKLTFFSKKNNIFIGFLLLLLSLYIFILLPNQDHEESFSVEEVTQELEDIEALQDYRRDQGYTGTGVMSGPHYASQEFYLDIHNRQITAYQKDNIRRYLHHRLYYLDQFGEEEYIQSDLFAGEPFPGKDRLHLYNQTLLRFQSYLDQDHTITMEMVEQKSTIQQMQQLISQLTIYLLFFSVIYFNNDTLTRDKEHKTLLQGLPLTWYSTLNIKSLVGLLYTLCILGGSFLFFIVINSLLNGFGHLELLLPFKEPLEQVNIAHYDYLSLFHVLLKGLSLIPIIAYIFIRLNIILSLIFKNPWAVLMVNTTLLMSGTFIYSRDRETLFGFDISSFPQIYFEVGKIASSEMNYLLNIDGVTYSKALVVLCITILAVELILWVTSKLVPKQRFY